MLAYLLVSGLASGCLYALVAVGLVVVYKSTTVVNFAHGELFMVAGFFAYTLHVLLRVPYLLAIGLAVALPEINDPPLAGQASAVMPPTCPVSVRTSSPLTLKIDSSGERLFAAAMVLPAVSANIVP